MFLAADGQDGNGLQLEKAGPTFSSCIVVSSKNPLKLVIGRSQSFRKFTCYLPIGVIGAFCAWKSNMSY